VAGHHQQKRLSFQERKETAQAANSSSSQLRKRGHLGRKAPTPGKKREVSEDQEGCGQTSQRTSPDWFDLKVRRMLKRASGLNKLMSIVHRMSMELERG